MNQECSNRDQSLISFFNEGHTLQEIGDRFGISRERARQILNRYGISKRTGHRPPPYRAALLTDYRSGESIQTLAERYGLKITTLRNVLSNWADSMDRRAHKQNATTRKIERFWGNVQKGDGCWEWQGKRFPTGYGRASNLIHGERYAHRIALSLHLGRRINLHVLHRCDNPSCVKPEHLWEGTVADNMADRDAKGRAAWQKDPNAWKAKLAAGREKTIARLGHWPGGGGKRGGTILDVEKVRDIKLRLHAGESIKDLANEYGVTNEMVWKISAGLRWSRVKIFP